jgi:hypothetical protein
MGTILDCLHLKVNLKKKIIYMITLIPNGVQTKIFSILPTFCLELRISPRIFEKIRNGPKGIIRGLGETVAVSLFSLCVCHRSYTLSLYFLLTVGPFTHLLLVLIACLYTLLLLVVLLTACLYILLGLSLSCLSVSVPLVCMYSSNP